MKLPLVCVTVLLFIVATHGKGVYKCDNVTFLKPQRNRLWAIGAPVVLTYSFECHHKNCKHLLRVGSWAGKFVCKDKTMVYSRKNKFRIECNARHKIVHAMILDETREPKQKIPVRVRLHGKECVGAGFTFRVRNCPRSYINKHLMVVSRGNYTYNSTGDVKCHDEQRVPFSAGRPVADNVTTCNAHSYWGSKEAMECWAAPTVHMLMGGYEFLVNESVTISCLVEDGYPPNSTAWLIIGKHKILSPLKHAFVVDPILQNTSVYCAASNAFTDYYKFSVKSEPKMLNILFPPTNFTTEVEKCDCNRVKATCTAIFIVSFVSNPFLDDSNVGITSAVPAANAKITRYTFVRGMKHEYRVTVENIKIGEFADMKFWGNATILGKRYETAFDINLPESCGDTSLKTENTTESSRKNTAITTESVTKTDTTTVPTAIKQRKETTVTVGGVATIRARGNGTKTAVTAGYSTTTKTLHTTAMETTSFNEFNNTTIWEDATGTIEEITKRTITPATIYVSSLVVLIVFLVIIMFIAVKISRNKMKDKEVRENGSTTAPNNDN